MKNKLFRIVSVVALFVAISGFTMQEEHKKDTYDQGHYVKKGQMSHGYNSPARINVEGAWDYFVTASFIYWQPKEKGLEVAIYRQDDDNLNHSAYSLVNMDFDFHPGFKVGLGMQSSYDDWNIYLEYTRLYTKNSASKTVPHDDDHHLYDTWDGTDGAACLHAKGTWKLHLNLLDFELARPFYVGTKLTFKPNVGARWGWITQKYRAQYDSIAGDTDDYNISQAKTTSWILGPRVGIDTYWHLTEGFRLFVNAAASIFYQDFDGKIDITFVDDEATTTAKYFDNKGYVNANFETAVGFGWGTYFSDDQWHFDLSAGYEFHYFLNQNMMRRLLETIDEITDAEASDLSLNGLTISARLDF